MGTESSPSLVETYKAKWSLLDQARKRLRDTDAAYYAAKKHGSEAECRALTVRIGQIEAEIAARSKEVSALMQELTKSGEFSASLGPRTG